MLKQTCPDLFATANRLVIADYKKEHDTILDEIKENNVLISSYQTAITQANIDCNASIRSEFEEQIRVLREHLTLDLLPKLMSFGRNFARLHERFCDRVVHILVVDYDGKKPFDFEGELKKLGDGSSLGGKFELEDCADIILRYPDKSRALWRYTYVGDRWKQVTNLPNTILDYLDRASRLNDYCACPEPEILKFKDKFTVDMAFLNMHLKDFGHNESLRVEKIDLEKHEVTFDSYGTKKMTVSEDTALYFVHEGWIVPNWSGLEKCG